MPQTQNAAQNVRKHQARERVRAYPIWWRAPHHHSARRGILGARCQACSQARFTPSLRPATTPLATRAPNTPATVLKHPIALATAGGPYRAMPQTQNAARVAAFLRCAGKTAVAQPIGSPDNGVRYGKQGSVALCRDHKFQSYREPFRISRPLLHQFLRFGVLGAH
jgi:hypothetical protein